MQLLNNNTNFLNLGTFYNNRESLKAEKPDDRGRKLIDALEFHEMYLLNGRARSDHPANCTYVSGNDTSMIDLIWCSYPGFDVCDNLYVCDFVTGSDHLPVSLELSITSHVNLNEPFTALIRDAKSEKFRDNI